MVKQQVIKVFIYLVWGVIFIALAELSLRQFDSLKTWNELNGKDFASLYDTTFFSDSWIHDRPMGEGELVLPEFSHEMNINSEGVRDVDIRWKKSRESIAY